MSTFNPITFLANVKRIFSAATGLTGIATWSYPTLQTSEIKYPAVFIEIIGGETGWYSTSDPNSLHRFYVRFVVFEDQTTSSSSLGSYFSVIGGELENGHLIYPGVNEVYDYENGDLCPDGKTGTLQVYVNGKRIENYHDYLIYPDSRVPPGDCIIVEFDDEADSETHRICDFWEVNDWTYDDYKEKRRPLLS